MHVSFETCIRGRDQNRERSIEITWLKCVFLFAENGRNPDGSGWKYPPVVEYPQIPLIVIVIVVVVAVVVVVLRCQRYGRPMRRR
jgi:ribose/xylose/arabinose/galactoside ABC-type transport system permease subunit